MFTWQDYEQSLSALRKSGARVFVVGHALSGRPIYGVFKGSFEGGQILLQAAIHAREGATTPVVLKMMENYSGGVGVWCLPMVDPDGVELCRLGLESVSDEEKRRFLLDVNGGSEDFSLWKANLNAVDLNVNFPAKWGTGAQNVTYPAPGNYIGSYPLSEPESRALHDFSLKIQPSITLSYHAKGELIYKGFEGVDPYPRLAEEVGATTGYGVYESAGSAGGDKDWFVTTSYLPGLTIEVGESGLSYERLFEQTESIYARNAQVLDICARFVQDIFNG